MDTLEITELLLSSYECVTQSVAPAVTIPNYIAAHPQQGRMFVIGAGKASAAMAAAFESRYDYPLEGLVITRYGHSADTHKIEVREAAHPVPDQAGQQAVSDMLSLLDNVSKDDTVVCLISGGGSALLSSPVDGVALEDIQKLNIELLASGASIHEINTVRKHLNVVLGGGLAKAVSPAKLITLAISDVVGDEPTTIASGATVADPTTLGDAKNILEKHKIDVSTSIHVALNDPKNETLKPSDPMFDRNEYLLVATPSMALKAAEAFWQKHDFDTYIFDEAVEGDTNEAAQAHVAFIKNVLNGKKQLSRPCAVLSGGETTVKFSGSGEGGPNTQFMLQAALLLQGCENVYAMACDTDGIDGSADNAGAFITPETLKLGEQAGVDALCCLKNNDSYAFFKAVGQLVETGPSYTNVNDYRVFLLLP